VSGFIFTENEDEEQLTLRNVVFQALGAASVCWSEVPSGIFESTRAQEVGHALLAWIEEYYVPKEEPR
jgi:hypothetical protein